MQDADYFDFEELHNLPAPPSDQPEILECNGCGKPCHSLAWIGDGWDFMGCDECVAECARQLEEELEREPLCTCIQTDVDLFEPLGCELHDSSSPWNVRRRSITMRQRYEEAA